MSTDDIILPSPEDDVLSEEELRTYQIKITTIVMEKIHKDILEALSLDISCSILGVITGNIDQEKKIISIGYNIPNDCRERDSECGRFLKTLHKENDILGFYTSDKTEHDNERYIQLIKPYISKQLSNCVILKMFEMPAERPPLFYTSVNNYTIKYTFSDRENEFHITVDSNAPELPTTPLIRHTGIRFLQTRSITSDCSNLLKENLIISPDQSRIGCHISMDYILSGIWKQGRVVVLPINNDIYLRCYLSFSKTKNNWLIGNSAYNEHKLDNPLIYDLEHLIGKKYVEIENELNKWNFKIVKSGEYPEIIINEDKDHEVKYDVIALYNILLCEIVKISLKFSEFHLRDINITVPSYFNKEQVAGMAESLNLYKSKLFLRGVVKEPIAAIAGYYYNLDQKIENGIYVVIILEKNRLNITINNVLDLKCDILYDSGEITNLSGKLIDNNIYNYFINQFVENGLDKNKLENNNKSLKHKLESLESEIIECRESFYSLSSKQFNFINSLFEIYDVESELSYSLYETINGNYKKMFLDKLNECTIRNGKCTVLKNEITNIILCGEYGRIRFIRDLISRNYSPIQLVNPEEIIGVGATVIN